MSNSVEQIRRALSETGLGEYADESLMSALSIIRILFSNSCCSRCCLRFVGCKEFQPYALSDLELLQAFTTLNNEYGSKLLTTYAAPAVNFICTACLGSIQHADSFVDEVCEKLAAEDYKVDSINLTSTLPVGILARDHLLKVHVKDILTKEGKHDLVRIWSDTKTSDPKDHFKYILGIKLKERTGLLLDADAPFRITVVIGHESTSKEHLFLARLKEPLLVIRQIRQKRQRVYAGDSRQNINNALKKLDNEEAREHTAVPPTVPTERAVFESMEMLNASSHVGGRYLKYSRDYSQTPWEVRGQKLTEHSVSEVFANILKKYHRADAAKFVTAGREDANVRMLGSGRPFYFELINPREPRLSDEMYQQIEHEINNQPQHKANVQVRHLSFIEPQHTVIIKEGEETKTKQYRALVWLSEPLTDELVNRINQTGSQPFTIYQKTPVRVYQRRSAAVRPKVIHTSTIQRLKSKVDLKSLDAHYGVLNLHTQAGTYIKEYVHGDLGRSMPNLASVGGVHSADLLELDVMDVDLEWPPIKSIKLEAEETDDPMLIDEKNHKRAYRSTCAQSNA